MERAVSIKSKASGSFFQKRTKKPLLTGGVVSDGANARRAKVFWFFFSKKNRLLPYPSRPLE
jgi:hypothetical protein